MRTPTDFIVDWYEKKTQFLLDKYGPGPRVHYHTGLAPLDTTPATTRDGLRAQLHEAQEEMVRYAARAWRGEERFHGKQIIDVGCGLGGTALLLAEEYGAHVTALSPVAQQLALVARFAAEAGVADRVHPVEGDCHLLDGPARFDVALSFGATTYFDRAVYFDRLRRIVRPGGWVFIEDTYLGRGDLAPIFDEYWTCHIGWPKEYEDAAAASGFRLVAVEDVAKQAAGFWKLSVEFRRLYDGNPKSVSWHSRMKNAYLDGGLRNLLYSFQRSG